MPPKRQVTGSIPVGCANLLVVYQRSMQHEVETKQQETKTLAEKILINSAILVAYVVSIYGLVFSLNYFSKYPLMTRTLAFLGI